VKVGGFGAPVFSRQCCRYVWHAVTPPRLTPPRLILIPKVSTPTLLSFVGWDRYVGCGRLVFNALLAPASGAWM
jgi:hypothetical protein